MHGELAVLVVRAREASRAASSIAAVRLQLHGGHTEAFNKLGGQFGSVKENNHCALGLRYVFQPHHQNRERES
jgi:hypothetical protein